MKPLSVTLFIVFVLSGCTSTRSSGLSYKGTLSSGLTVIHARADYHAERDRVDEQAEDAEGTEDLVGAEDPAEPDPAGADDADQREPAQVGTAAEDETVASHTEQATAVDSTETAQDLPPFTVTFSPSRGRGRGFDYFKAVQILDPDSGEEVRVSVTGLDTNKLVVVFPTGVSAQEAIACEYRITVVDGRDVHQMSETAFMALRDYRGSFYGNSIYTPMRHTYTYPHPSTGRPVQFHSWH